MLEDILYVLGQLFLIGLYSLVILVVFCVILAILAVLAKALHDTINKKGN